MKSDIRAIAFDFGNTLCPWDEEQYWQVTRATLGHICAIGNGLDLDSAHEVFFRLRAEESSRKLPRLAENDFRSILGETAQELLGRPLEGCEIEELVNVHTTAFINVCLPPPGLLPMLDRLSRRYALAVVSNYPLSPCIRLAVERLGIDRFLAATIVSGDLGVIKPSGRIFKSVLSELQLPPENVLFVGDDWIADVVGACASGMPVVHVVNGDAGRNPRTLEGVFGGFLRQALELPEFWQWQDASPQAVVKSVLELEGWLERADG